MHAPFSRRRGFTLVEVLIATVVLSIGIVTVLCAFQRSLFALGVVRDDLWAGLLIKERIAALGGAAQEGDDNAFVPSQGRFSGPYKDFEWATVVSDVELPIDPADVPEPFVLRQVTVRVWRDDPEKNYESTVYLRQKRAMKE